MTLDGGWALIISGVLVLFLSGVAVLIWRHVDNAQVDADQASKAVQKLETDVLKFQVHVAETYARLSGVERMESSLSATMVRFENKLDKIIGDKGPRHV